MSPSLQNRWSRRLGCMDESPESWQVGGGTATSRRRADTSRLDLRHHVLMPDQLDEPRTHAVAAAGPGDLTERQARARDLEFRSFAVMSFEVLLLLTDIWFFVWPLALPLLGGFGLAWAIAAWRMPDRRPRFVAPVLAAIHLSPFVLVLYLLAR